MLMLIIALNPTHPSSEIMFANLRLLRSAKMMLAVLIMKMWMVMMMMKMIK